MNAHRAIGCIGASLLAGALLLPVGCSSPPPDKRTEGTLPGPGPDAFKPVADMLGSRCGTIDCHGNIARSLRVYSWSGLRVSPNISGQYDAGPNGLVLTTEEEYQATYYSVVTLEPEILAEVLAQHGAHPERLTIVRKARGTEHHKGNKVIQTGGDADRCLLSWLAGKVDQQACQKGGQLPRPTGF